MDVTTTTESEQYDTKGLVNSLGGALSLCLGISLIMIFELIELAIRMITIFFYKLFKLGQ